MIEVQAHTDKVVGHSDRRLLLLDPADNCLIACTFIARGTAMQANGVDLNIFQDIPLGHKVSRQHLRLGDEVLRHGAVIGTVTSDVRPGEHLHLHNLKSGYLPTYTRDDGSRFGIAKVVRTERI